MARSGRDEPFTTEERETFFKVLIAFKRVIAAPPDSKEERRAVDVLIDTFVDMKKM